MQLSAEIFQVIREIKRNKQTEIELQMILSYMII